MIPVPINDLDRRTAKTLKQVPILRTIRMLGEHYDADLLIAFWDGASPGTQFTIKEADWHGIPIELHRV